MYKFRYAVRERRVTITLNGSGVSLELVGPKAAWFLRNMMRRANEIENICPFCGFRTISKFEICPRCLNPKTREVL